MERFMPGRYIPSEHMIMVWIMFGALLVAMILYFFAPVGKSEAFMAIMTTAIGFITGKFSNGYSRPRKPDQDKEEGNE